LAQDTVAKEVMAGMGEGAMRIARAGAIVLMALVLGGCVRVRAGICNVGSDLMDLARADVSFSLGTDMGAHVMVTKLVQLKSYSYEDLYRVGYNPRMLGVWKEDRQDFWVGPICGGRFRVNSKSIAGLSGEPMMAKARGGRWAAQGILFESPDEVGVGAHLFVIGARVGVRPLEFVDLLASFVGLDLLHDNLSWRQRAAMRAMEQNAGQIKLPEAPKAPVQPGG
jgi:hypothetical protein